MPKRRALLLLGLMLGLYPVSYLVVSRDGFYDPGAVGLGQGPEGTTIFVSKRGYKWQPFEGFCDLDDFPNTPIPALFSTLYRPLLELDRTFWHTEQRAGSRDFPAPGGGNVTIHGRKK
jgi:hypothetical protein